MSRKVNVVLVLLIALGIAASFTVFKRRLAIESGNRVVQLVMDYADAREFALATGYPLDEFLVKMKEAGLQSIGVREARVGDMVEDGRAIVLPAVHGTDSFVGSTLAASVRQAVERAADAGARSIVILPKADWAAGFIADLSTRLIGCRVSWELAGTLTGARYVVATSVSANRLARQRVGMDRNRVAGLRDLGFQIVPRYGNFRGNTPAGIRTMLAQLDWVGEPSLVIFEGRDLLGYGKHLGTTAAAMSAQGFSLGLIELSRQRGEEAVAVALDYNALRVHSVSKSEMRVLKPKIVVERYVRAARERGIRVLYVRPFPERTDSVRLVSANRDFICSLVKDLKDANYSVGTAHAYKALSAPLWVLVLAALGTSCAAALVLWHILGVGFWWRVAVAVGGLAIFAVMYAVGRGVMARQMMALVAAIALPSLAILSQYFLSRRAETKPDSVGRSGWLAFWFLVRVSAISALGGVLVVGLLGDTRFVLKLSQFVGVKLMHIAPIAVVAWVLLGAREWLRGVRSAGAYLASLYRDSIPVRYLVWFGAVGLLAFVYLQRTGNDSMLPVFGFEKAFRSLLEQLLVARPRTKEFLLGHPLLMLGSALALGGYRRAAIPAIILGTIGQASIVDTYAHIHSPVIMSTLRWIYSVMLGGAVGAALIYATDIVLKRSFRFEGGIAQAPPHIARARRRRVRGARNA